MDLIDRRQAIELICEETCGFEKLDCIGYRCKIVKAIEKMPSAEPEQKTGKCVPVITESDEEFEGCHYCVYSEDSIENCMLRKCSHAVSYLKDCYKSKKGVNHV